MDQIWFYFSIKITTHWIQLRLISNVLLTVMKFFFYKARGWDMRDIRINWNSTTPYLQNLFVFILDTFSSFKHVIQTKKNWIIVFYRWDLFIKQELCLERWSLSIMINHHNFREIFLWRSSSTFAVNNFLG